MRENQTRPDLEERIKNQLGEIERLHAIVEGFTAAHELPPKVTFNIVLVLEELLVNTISYGYQTDEEREIVLRFWWDDGWITIQVDDDAAQFDPLARDTTPPIGQTVEERQVGGVGIHLVKTMMDDVDYRWVDGRNVLTLRKQVVEQ